MKFEVLESEVVFRGRVFDVHRDLIGYPDGRKARVDMVVHEGAVTIVPVDQEGFIWFIRQYRHPAGKILLELPAGVLEKGENPEEGAKREIREEIGMAAGHLQKLGGIYLAPGYSSEYLTIFLATQLSSDPLEADEDEMIEIERIRIVDAFRIAEAGSIEDAKTLAALLLVRPLIVDWPD